MNVCRDNCLAGYIHLALGLSTQVHGWLVQAKGEVRTFHPDGMHEGYPARIRQ